MVTDQIKSQSLELTGRLCFVVSHVRYAYLFLYHAHPLEEYMPSALTFALNYTWVYYYTHLNGLRGKLIEYYAVLRVPFGAVIPRFGSASALERKVPFLDCMYLHATRRTHASRYTYLLSNTYTRAYIQSRLNH